MFQDRAAQFGCISCDKIGNSYQELQGQTGCTFCPPNTQRYVDILSGATVDACQCKEGKDPAFLWRVSLLVSLSATCVLVMPSDVQGTLPSKAGLARYGA
jgi:hypothetical protein